MILGTGRKVLLSKAVCDMADICRLDRLTVAVCREGSEARELILIDKFNRTNKRYNPRRSRVVLTIPETDVRILQWEEGQELTCTIFELNNSSTVLGFNETRTYTDIPDFSKLSMESLKKRLNLNKKPKKSLQSSKNSIISPFPIEFDKKDDIKSKIAVSPLESLRNSEMEFLKSGSVI